MKKFFRNKITVVAIVITVCVTLIGLVFGNNNFISGSVRTLYMPVLTLTSGVAAKINGLQTYFADIDGYKNQNSQLAKEVAELKRSGQSAAEYKEKIDRLESLLELKGDMEQQFALTAAKVVSYTSNNWYNTIVINKGEWSGIAVGDAVISDRGVVGKVTEVGAGHSVISTILSSENSIAVRNVRSGKLAVVEGDASLSGEKLCKMSFVEKSSDIMLGDLIETTGGGGVYPEGITVGSIKEIKAENTEEFIVIQPAVDVAELYEVLVVSSSDE